MEAIHSMAQWALFIIYEFDLLGRDPAEEHKAVAEVASHAGINQVRSSQTHPGGLRQEWRLSIQQVVPTIWARSPSAGPRNLQSTTTSLPSQVQLLAFRRERPAGDPWGCWSQGWHGKLVKPIDGKRQWRLIKFEGSHRGTVFWSPLQERS